MPNNKLNTVFGRSSVDLYSFDFSCTYMVPREAIVHVPAQRLNITRLVACKNFSTAVAESNGVRMNDEQWSYEACKMGSRCKFVHVSQPLSNFPRQALHAHYIWRSLEDVTYERLWDIRADGPEAPRIALSPCALCAVQINDCFNQMGGKPADPPVFLSKGPSSAKASSLEVSEAKDTFPMNCTCGSHGEAEIEQIDVAGSSTNPTIMSSATFGSVQQQRSNHAFGSSLLPAKPDQNQPPNAPNITTQEGILIDVVITGLSSMTVPAYRFLKTAGSSRALASVLAGDEPQQFLQTCYEFACENECKKGPDCDKAHVINMEPSLEVPFVRRSMRHVKAAVGTMLRGPPNGALKPPTKAISKLAEEDIEIPTVDIKLAEAAEEFSSSAEQKGAYQPFYSNSTVPSFSHNAVTQSPAPYVSQPLFYPPNAVLGGGGGFVTLGHQGGYMGPAGGSLNQFHVVSAPQQFSNSSQPQSFATHHPAPGHNAELGFITNLTTSQSIPGNGGAGSQQPQQRGGGWSPFSSAWQDGSLRGSPNNAALPRPQQDWSGLTHHVSSTSPHLFHHQQVQPSGMTGLVTTSSHAVHHSQQPPPSTPQHPQIVYGMPYPYNNTGSHPQFVVDYSGNYHLVHPQ